MTDEALLLKAYRHMYATVCMARLYDENRSVCKYVHSTSLGHQAIQLAVGYQLGPADWVSPYYRDEALLLAMGWTPHELMLQLLAKADDPFSGGRSYYSHPSSTHAQRPQMLHQSSATGMQVIPATGLAHGLHYLQKPGVVVCSLGDASMTEGEVSEALQVAVLYQLPILYLVQDNEWGISVSAAEARAMDAVQFAQGFPGLLAERVDGADFEASYQAVQRCLQHLRTGGGPVLLQARVPLLGHHTSGVRREFYRAADDMARHQQLDPVPRLRQRLLQLGVHPDHLAQLEATVANEITDAFARAQAAPEPDEAAVMQHVFAPTPVQHEAGTRQPAGADKVMMVDAALFAIREILAEYPEALLYGQDVGRRLGGVFREAATLAEQFGDHRVFNTAIQEAYIVGSTAGMSAAGAKPIVEIQFADYVYPGINQLVTELSKSSYLSMGKRPVQALIRIPIGAYGGGGPYHSGSIESTLLSIKGIKVVYPSNAADMKGLMKAAFLDPNPVVMLEHKGLYWSKVPGTEAVRCPEPSADYIIPLGQARTVLAASAATIAAGDSCCVITYGMGVYWALAAAQRLPGQVEVLDLRTLAPVDEAAMVAAVERHGKCLVLTEEQQSHSFAESLAGRLQQACFARLDAPIQVMGALDLPAVPINMALEKAMLPNADKVYERLTALLRY
ncbi:MAG: thiamine pyrophosphate-dependent enzyme [Chitinophagaceae bacterium]|nr:thiamine pyrophosphate-dependent enzyme [Chitinophagaceae bacterium]